MAAVFDAAETTGKSGKPDLPVHPRFPPKQEGLQRRLTSARSRGCQADWDCEGGEPDQINRYGSGFTAL
jgi:hypothetical protein